jgi:hypothetical protein
MITRVMFLSGQAQQFTQMHFRTANTRASARLSIRALTFSITRIFLAVTALLFTTHWLEIHCPSISSREVLCSGSIGG